MAVAVTFQNILLTLLLILLSSIDEKDADKMFEDMENALQAMFKECFADIKDEVVMVRAFKRFCLYQTVIFIAAILMPDLVHILV